MMEIKKIRTRPLGIVPPVTPQLDSFSITIGHAMTGEKNTQLFSPQASFTQSSLVGRVNTIEEVHIIITPLQSNRQLSAKRTAGPVRKVQAEEGCGEN
ncbi:hypothetical protein PGTUg99_013934 [Puccinia graminis f. sp. tritici]|uniref:Uncharacterized protein n=1 Tax=Puccinia graminis f. sp. tritici TaxID=56615 RepID=A0A5B0R5S4_PUCGR|nr:hypothetical protein PGTUg99_013934 [Puccinia graminis f. sp. tritici]